jgi:hypothetical protein
MASLAKSNKYVRRRDERLAAIVKSARQSSLLEGAVDIEGIRFKYTKSGRIIRLAKEPR